MKNFFSKFILIASLLLSAVAFPVALTAPTFAAPDTSEKGNGGNNTNTTSPATTPGGNTTGGDSTSTTTSSDCRYFLGLVSWDCQADINGIDGETDLKQRIWTIAGNVAADLTVIAAYLILGYVIYGGYLYICSSGDPGKVATGKKALAQAFIGLAIVMSANVILNFVRIALGQNFSSQCVSINQGDGTISTECYEMNAAGDMITSVISWVIGVAGVVAVIFIVMGGISYITSNGDPQKTQQAKNIILYALIGLVLVALAEIITAFVSNLIRSSTQTALNNNPAIALELPAESHTTTTTLIKKEFYEITQIR